MRLNIFLSIISFAVPIAFLNGVLESAEIFCHSTIPIVGLSLQTSGFNSFSMIKRCNKQKAEFMQIGNCWEPGDLLSQRRYCLEEAFNELETALVD
tara:strand:+ start:1407 stop:1694 length:288 start_codon:yes stop_codon:yes gene_type:complete